MNNNVNKKTFATISYLREIINISSRYIPSERMRFLAREPIYKPKDPYERTFWSAVHELQSIRRTIKLQRYRWSPISSRTHQSFIKRGYHSRHIKMQTSDYFEKFYNKKTYVYLSYVPVHERLCITNKLNRVSVTFSGQTCPIVHVKRMGEDDTFIWAECIILRPNRHVGNMATHGHLQNSPLRPDAFLVRSGFVVTGKHSSVPSKLTLFDADLQSAKDRLAKRIVKKMTKQIA